MQRLIPVVDRSGAVEFDGGPRQDQLVVAVLRGRVFQLESEHWVAPEVEQAHVVDRLIVDVGSLGALHGYRLVDAVGVLGDLVVVVADGRLRAPCNAGLTDVAEAAADGAPRRYGGARADVPTRR